jgi:hypothetical protein
VCVCVCVCVRLHESESCNHRLQLQVVRLKQVMLQVLKTSIKPMPRSANTDTHGRLH